MAEVALITSADQWDMKDETTGKPLSGVSIWFLNAYRDDSDQAFGFKPTKVSGTPEMLDALRGKLPGLFEMQYGSRPGAQGKAALTLVGVKFIKSVDLFGNPAKQAQPA